MVSTFGLILIYTEGVFVNAVACYVNCNPRVWVICGHLSQRWRESGIMDSVISIFVLF